MPASEVEGGALLVRRVSHASHASERISGALPPRDAATAALSQSEEDKGREDRRARRPPGASVTVRVAWMPVASIRASAA